MKKKLKLDRGRGVESILVTHVQIIRVIVLYVCVLLYLDLILNKCQMWVDRPWPFLLDYVTMSSIYCCNVNPKKKNLFHCTLNRTRNESKVSAQLYDGKTNGHVFDIRYNCINPRFSNGWDVKLPNNKDCKPPVLPKSFNVFVCVCVCLCVLAN